MFIKYTWTYIGIRKREIGSGTKLLFTFLSLNVFRQEERERATIFLCWLLLRLQLSTQPTRGARSVQSRLASPSSESQLSSPEGGNTTHSFFSNLSPRFRCVTSPQYPDSNSYLGFLFWHFWMTHPLLARVKTRVNVTPNSCAKRKVLTLTKPKGKIYKTKSLGNYITHIYISSVQILDVARKTC